MSSPLESEPVFMTSAPKNSLTRIAVSIPTHAIDVFDGALEPFVQSLLWSVDDESDIQLMEGFSESPPNETLLASAMENAAKVAGIAVPHIKIEQIKNRDWVAENLEQFPPIIIGRFYIYGAHIDAPLPPSCISLRIDQSVAFGTGSHATTAGCLLAISRIFKTLKPKRVLDMGTGSGILALAMAKLWHIVVVACDIDPVATKVARDNAALNHLGGYIKTGSGNGFAALKATHLKKYAQKKFHLITANILARPLASIAGDMTSALLPGGRVVLSGLICSDEKMVLNAYRRYGLYLESRIVIDGWLTLVLKKPGTASTFA